MIKKISILRSNFIGVYSRVWEDIAFLPFNAEDFVEKDFLDILKVETRKVLINNSPLIGTMMVLNSNGIIIGKNDFDDGRTLTVGDRNFLSLKDKMNAVGNDILANDHGAMVHKSFTAAAIKKISDTLGVEVIKGTIGDIKTVGSAAVLTQKGLLTTPEVSDDEIDFLSNFFKVPAKSGTANFGNLYVGSSIVANSKGVLVGEDTTPIEIGRIDDILA
ncbi:MAG: translation initiation factor IF-6 [Thermoplasmataceae archaeon]|jgi:translation initiation factor 6|nr:translation initiation factor IF-6 [Candidatus Thermoplasmatota archaeon]